MKGHTLIALRDFNGLSQEEFSAKIGYARSSIAKVEAGYIEPSRRLISAIARNFTITDDIISYLRKFEKLNGLNHDYTVT